MDDALVISDVPSTTLRLLVAFWQKKKGLRRVGYTCMGHVQLVCFTKRTRVARNEYMCGVSDLSRGQKQA